MCETCGCGDLEAGPDDRLTANERQARHNREHFTQAGVTAIHLVGAPGSGRTRLLEATAARLGPERAVGAICGALSTERDAERLRAAGVKACGVITGSVSHLDAALVHHALHELDWRGSHVLFVENVGNLVDPAFFGLGEHLTVVTLSVTQGPDVPIKFPIAFRHADLVVLTKVDLLPHLSGVTIAAFERSLRRVMVEPRLMPVSSVSGEGLDEWLAFVESARSQTVIKLGASYPGHSH